MSGNTNQKEGSVVRIPVSKHSYRKKVWDYLTTNNMVDFPKPVLNQIPNFKGCRKAARRMSQLAVFINAQNILVNSDQPQEPVRFVVLQHKKNLFVPKTRYYSGLLKRILLTEDANMADIKKAVSRREIYRKGLDVNMEDEIEIDMVVLGSIAVSKEGYRIGNGDLEFGILSHMKAINPMTIVVTTVHDSQVFNTLPTELFGPRDVPVDVIITPTKVINVAKLLPKPQGLIWNLLTHKIVDLNPVLKTLKEIDEKAGKDVSLKEIDTANKNISSEKRRAFYEFRTDCYRSRTFFRKRPQPDSEGATSENGSAHTGRDRNTPQHDKRRPKRNFRKNKPMIDFSLMVKNIEKDIRIHNLKAALAERGIKPNIITWRGYSGYCYLHFKKTNPNIISDLDQNSHGVNYVINKLQNLRLSPNSETQISIEIVKPVSRIETTNVTSV